MVDAKLIFKNIYSIYLNNLYHHSYSVPVSVLAFSVKNTPPTILNSVSRVDRSTALISIWPWKGQFYQLSNLYS